MKATFKIPKTGKGWACFALILFTIALGGWPVVPFLNTETLVLGMPIIMVWSIFIIFFTTLVMVFIDKIGGAD